MDRSLLVMVLPLALAGCLGEPSPTSTPAPTTTTIAPTQTTTTSPSPTASSSPTSTTPSPTTTPTTTPAAPYHVHVGSNGTNFDPETLQVNLARTVEWHHHGGTHTVTIHKDGAPNGQYVQDSSLSAGSVQYVFTQSGTYHVFCKPHSSGEQGVYTPTPINMASTVTVS